MATRFDIEAMIRGMQEEIRKKQIASGQMTLGAFITALESMPREMPVRFDVGSIPGKPDSYRGYYEQLAFSYDGTPGETVGGVLVSAQGAMGRGWRLHHARKHTRLGR